MSNVYTKKLFLFYLRILKKGYFDFDGSDTSQTVGIKQKKSIKVSGIHKQLQHFTTN